MLCACICHLLPTPELEMSQLLGANRFCLPARPHKPPHNRLLFCEALLLRDGPIAEDRLDYRLRAGDCAKKG